MPPVAKSRAAARTSCGSTPVTSAVASGECCSSAMKRAQDLEIGEIAALAHESLVDEPFGHDDMRERIDDRDVRAGPQREMIVGLDMRRAHEIDAARDRRRSASRPARRRLFMREANTGCASVGLAPMTRMTSDLSTDLKSCVPAEVPKVWLRP